MNRETGAENLVGAFAVMGIVIAFIWLSIRKIARAPRTPDPWDNEVALAVEDESAVPLCTHCLTPYHTGNDFCEKCGAPVGDLTNYMPPAYYYSLGYVLRCGADGNFKPSPVAVTGFFACAMVWMFFLLVPFYWLRVIMNVARLKESPPLAANPDDASSGVN